MKSKVQILEINSEKNAVGWLVKEIFDIKSFGIDLTFGF